MSRIKNRPSDEKAAAVDLRRILVGTDEDLNHYINSFRTLISMGQDLWITSPAWLVTKERLDSQEKSQSVLGHLMVIRQYHETVLAGMRRLLQAREKMLDIRRRIKVSRDLFELHQEFHAEVLNHLFSLPSVISESVLQLEVIRENYRDDMRAALPEAFVDRFFRFLDEAAKATPALMPSETELGELNGIVAETAAAAAGIATAMSGDQIVEPIEGDGIVVPPVAQDAPATSEDMDGTMRSAETVAADQAAV